MAYGIFGRNQLSGRASVLPNLTLLDLGHNNYTEVSFADLPSSLQLLYLGNNGLSGSMPPLLDLPANLTFLDISNNMLSGPLHAALPPKLAILNASGNSLSGPLPGNWSTAKRLAELRLDNNMFTGVLPASWSAWGKISRNSLQLSITNTSLHGRIPQQWVEQFCLAIVESSLPQILFEEHVLHVNVQTISRDVVAAPVIELPAQHASINVTLGVHFFSFDYNSPGSICGIPNAPRNIGLVWGIYAAVFLASIAVVQLWPSGKKGVCTACVSSKLRNLTFFRLSCCSGSSQSSICKRVAERLWFFLSDGVFSVYSQVTDAITIYHVFASKQLQYAFLLLAMWLLPALVMLAAVARVSSQVCQDQISPYSSRRLTRVSLYLLGLLLSPILLVGLQFAMILQGVGVPLPACLKLFNVDLYTCYRLQSFAESFLSALPQSVLQSKLYMMGNDPRGVHVYINTTLFLYSIVGSFFSVLKSVIILLIERRTYRCGFVTYCTTMLKLDSLREYEVFSQETAGIELA